MMSAVGIEWNRCAEIAMSVLYVPVKVDREILE